MAPELVTSGTPVTTKADIYSFAIVLWEIVSPNQDLLAAWEASALGHSGVLRTNAVIPTWAMKGQSL